SYTRNQPLECKENAYRRLHDLRKFPTRPPPNSRRISGQDTALGASAREGETAQFRSRRPISVGSAGSEPRGSSPRDLRDEGSERLIARHLSGSRPNPP